MSTNLKDLFNPGGIETPATSRNTDEYKVSFKEGKGGVYTSVIRFVPYAANPAKSIMYKQVSYVKNPISNQAVYVDDPRSIGQRSPIVDMFFQCWNTNNAQIREFGKNHLSTKDQYAALVQIIHDEQRPELEGKIKVFKFGKKLAEKLKAEQTGIMGNGVNPFSPITGRYFMIKCISQSGFNNFDQSAFFDAKNATGANMQPGLWYAPDMNNPSVMTPVTAESDQQAVADYLIANSPDLSKYDYVPWNAQDDKFINDTLAIVANYLEKGTLQSNLQAVNTASTAGIHVNLTPVFPGATPQAASSAAAVNLSGLQFGSTSIDRAPQAAAPAPSVSGIDIPNIGSVPAASSSAPGIGGNLDDIISRL